MEKKAKTKGQGERALGKKDSGSCVEIADPTNRLRSVRRRGIETAMARRTADCC
jgi:hypothetical protein